MPIRDYSPTRKALEINLDDSIYGTFAEIGAGQEVARHFFQAGRASHTIAKTISAYDMTFSDEIYGKEGRYVCEARLLKMLDHEFSLLQERLRSQRGPSTRFFAFANTVATGSNEDGQVKSHGWLGVRFQLKPNGPVNDIILHVRLWDRFRLQQQEALGVLGVNLMHLAFFPPDVASERITALIESLNTKRIEVNLIRFKGQDLNHLDNRLLNLELVKQGLTEAVLFNAKGEVQNVSDALFKKAVLIQRGQFRPVTTANLDILHKVLQQLKSEPKVLFEITMNSLASEGGETNDEDFLHRVDTLGALGHDVLLSNFALFYQMKFFLRQYTREEIGISVGASLLPKIFDEKFYGELTGGVLEGMSRLFDSQTRLYVFPHKDDLVCETAATFSPNPKMLYLYKHLLSNDLIIDLLNCETIDASIHSSEVRELLKKGDDQWRKYVPNEVAKIIEERQLFNFRPKVRK